MEFSVEAAVRGGLKSLVPPATERRKMPDIFTRRESIGRYIGFMCRCRISEYLLYVVLRTREYLFMYRTKEYLFQAPTALRVDGTTSLLIHIHGVAHPQPHVRRQLLNAAPHRLLALRTKKEQYTTYTFTYTKIKREKLEGRYTLLHNTVI